MVAPQSSVLEDSVGKVNSSAKDTGGGCSSSISSLFVTGSAVPVVSQSSVVKASVGRVSSAALETVNTSEIRGSLSPAFSFPEIGSTLTSPSFMVESSVGSWVPSETMEAEISGTSDSFFLISTSSSLLETGCGISGVSSLPLASGSEVASDTAQDSAIGTFDWSVSGIGRDEWTGCEVSALDVTGSVFISSHSSSQFSLAEPVVVVMETGKLIISVPEVGG